MHAARPTGERDPRGDHPVFDQGEDVGTDPATGEPFGWEREEQDSEGGAGDGDVHGSERRATA